MSASEVAPMTSDGPAAAKYDMAKPHETKATLTYVDANGLALACFGFTTWLFACLNLNINYVTSEKGGFHMAPAMLTWGAGVGLLVAGIVQGLNGDKLGFTSYVFHSLILGTIGYNIDTLLTGAAGGNGMALAGLFSLAAAWVNCIFTIMAFKAAKMFGVLYATVALLFFAVGLAFNGALEAKAGNDLVGACSIIVALQCFYLLLPVLTGHGYLF